LRLFVTLDAEKTEWFLDERDRLMLIMLFDSYKPKSKCSLVPLMYTSFNISYKDDPSLDARSPPIKMPVNPPPNAKR
jgi:hypothetical protein